MRSGKRALNRLLKRAIGYQLISTAHLEKVEGETRRNAKVREQNEAARQKNKALRDDLALRAERVRRPPAAECGPGQPTGNPGSAD